MFPVASQLSGNFDYFLFEERFRGNEEIIKDRQKSYVDLFLGRDNVVDLGCGRGEFLELMRENRITARGADANLDMILSVKDKGLDVVQQDLFTFLESLPDESTGGIFCSQVIEHLATSEQLKLLELVRRKSKPGSPVVLETINPECVFALVRNFFLDPTHVRPVHPEMLRFALESSGFSKVELRFSEPLTSAQIPKLILPQATPELDQFNRGIENLNRFLYGYQDYAAIAWR
jgi:O-antigen chain-terminating methyltransferase